MKKLLLSLAMLFPLQAIAADDSVYTWGAWSQGIQPAAGPVAHAATPAPVKTPNAKFRANEHSVFNRTADDTQGQALAARQAALAAAEAARQAAAEAARQAAQLAAAQAQAVRSAASTHTNTVAITTTTTISTTGPSTGGF